MIQRVLHLVCLISVFLASPAATVPTQAAGDRAVVGDGRFGVDEAFVNPDAAVALGATWDRVIFQWSQIQPNSSADWVTPATPSLDQLRAERAKGIDVTGLLINTPTWAQAQQSSGTHSPPAGLSLPFDDSGNTWGQFCKAMAQRYAGVVTSWIVWNEPDIWDSNDAFFTWASDAPTYYQLVKVANQAIKSVDPSAKIVLAGTTFYWDANAGKPQFLGQVLDAAAADPTAEAHNDYFDAVGAHVYTTATNAYWVPRAFQALLANHGMRQPIWIDEMNVAPYDDAAASVPPGPPYATRTQQAAFMVQAYAEARAAGVERIGVYKLMDGGVQAGAPYGLLRDDGARRPAYAALQTAVATLGSFPNAVMRAGGHHIAIEFSSGSRRATVAWNTGPTPYTMALCALGNTASVFDDTGAARSATATGASPRVYGLPLTPTSAHGLFDGRDLYYIGGEPVIVVEDGLSPGATCAPPPPHDARYFAQTGFRVDNDPFWSYFQGRGGISTFGYPVSRTFQFLGFTTQIFQRQAMQLGSDGGVRLLNVLDPGLLPYTGFRGSVFPAASTALLATAPAPGSPGYADAVVQFVQANAPDVWQGKHVRFFQTFQSTVSLSRAFPIGGGNPALLTLLNLEIWGLPTSPPMADPTNQNFVYQRFQRGVMHYDAGCDCTQGILFGDYLKEVITGQGLPFDLGLEADSSPLIRQYDIDSATWRTRPSSLPASDLTYAFERG